MSVKVKNKHVYTIRTNVSNAFLINLNKSELKKAGGNVSLGDEILAEFRFKNRAGKVPALLRIYEYDTHYKLYVPVPIVELLEAVFGFDAGQESLTADLSFNEDFEKLKITLKEED